MVVHDEAWFYWVIGSCLFIYAGSDYVNKVSSVGVGGECGSESSSSLLGEWGSEGELASRLKSLSAIKNSRCRMSPCSVLFASKNIPIELARCGSCGMCFALCFSYSCQDMYIDEASAFFIDACTIDVLASVFVDIWIC